MADRFNWGNLVEYSFWVLERKRQKVLMAMVFISSFTNTSYSFFAYSVKSRMGINDVSHISRGLFFGAIFGCEVASTLAEVNACQ